MRNLMEDILESQSLMRGKSLLTFGSINSLSLLIVRTRSSLASHFSLLLRSLSELERPRLAGLAAPEAAPEAAPATAAAPALVMAISLETRPLAARPGATGRRAAGGGGGPRRDGGGDSVDEDFLVR